MIKKIMKPLWSYDIQKTEKWLSYMAETGYMLSDINVKTSIFYFQKGRKEIITYRIGYDRTKTVSMPSSLLREGWEEVIQKNGWYVISISKVEAQTKLFPDREGIINKNRTKMYIFMGISFYFLFSTIIFLLITSFLTLSENVTVTVEESSLWFLRPILQGIGISIYLFVFYSAIKLFRSNKRLAQEMKPKEEEIETILEGLEIENLPSRKEEKELKRQGKILLKRRLGWMYAPDKLEEWLEKMEKEGYNLYRTNKTGTLFYFWIGKSRNIKYCVDFQSKMRSSYFDIHKDAGWKLFFTSYGNITKWSIWAQEYVGEDVPQLYSDKADHLSHAKKVALTYSLLFLPLVIFYMWNVISMIQNALYQGISNLTIVNLILFGVWIMIFGSFSVRTWLFYRRLKIKS